MTYLRIFLTKLHFFDIYKELSTSLSITRIYHKKYRLLERITEAIEVYVKVPDSLTFKFKIPDTKTTFHCVDMCTMPYIIL